ncbi:DUF4198 domain-containing protein [Acetobacterium paludosum]|uniref:DUF4198 domain-containing protein n=1 Tax=Acetobacterium paludosum TaxID=52693 RepID=A0A923HZW1_9FIRM|nr:DUF4198 domain-containing protein [Acetobacterium paludosum]MBC3889076.1 DUF4198 domain-containing protein [Acetobacterium paludosum]
MMKIEFLDTTDHMVYGHEGWLVPGTNHVHEGDAVEVFTRWGHNMEGHGLARKEGLTVGVVMPDGNTEDLLVDEYDADNYVIRYTPIQKGLYHFIGKYVGLYVIDQEGKFQKGTLKDYPDAKSATSFTQYSHLTMMVGHNITPVLIPDMLKLPLRIEADEYTKWQPGEKIGFQLLTIDSFLANTELDLAFQGEENKPVVQRKLITNASGRFLVKAEEAGQYLLIARNLVPVGKAGFYNDTKYTYTYYFNVKNRKVKN